VFGMVRRPAAVRAIGELLHHGMLEIRSLARERQIADEGQTLSGEQSDEDFASRIYMIAEVCHSFAGPLGSVSLLKRERSARHALRWRWGTSGPAARHWIASVLSDVGPEYRDFLEVIAREHDRWISKHPIAPWALQMDESSDAEGESRA
jgi:hypothetical protein